MAATDVAAGFRVVTPSAVSGDWRRTVYLSFTLAATELKVRFFGSALGYVWSLMRPLMFFGVLYIVFSQLLRLGNAIEFYPDRPADGDRALHVRLRGDGRRRRGDGQAREPDPPGRLPAPRHPAGRHGDGGVQPAHEPHRRVRLHGAHGPGVRLRADRRRPLDLAGAAASARAADHPGARRGAAAVGPLRALSRHQADLVGRPAGALLRDADPLSGRGGARTSIRRPCST